jgi:hypothetical protein
VVQVVPLDRLPLRVGDRVDVLPRERLRGEVRGAWRLRDPVECL